MLTLLYMLVCWVIVVDFLVIFLSSKDDTPADTPAPRRPFSQLTPLDQHLHTSCQPLGRAVQTASVRMSSSLLISVTGGEARPGKFNFGLGTGVAEMNLVEMEAWRRLDFCLCRVWSLPRRCH